MKQREVLDKKATTVNDQVDENNKNLSNPLITRMPLNEKLSITLYYK